jgi:hypothetical protein
MNEQDSITSRTLGKVMIDIIVREQDSIMNRTLGKKIER